MKKLEELFEKQASTTPGWSEACNVVNVLLSTDLTKPMQSKEVVFLVTEALQSAHKSTEWLEFLKEAVSILSTVPVCVASKEQNEPTKETQEA